MSLDETWNSTTLKVYLYLVQNGPAGPRDVMRATDLSSPSVAHRHLQKLVDMGLVQNDMYGMYDVKEKAILKGYLWLGKNLVSRLILYFFFFIGLFIMEIATLIVLLYSKEPMNSTFVFTIIVTGLSATLFLLEGRLLHKP